MGLLPLLVVPKGEKKSVSLSFIADRRPKIRFLSSSSFAIREMEARVFFGDAGMGLDVLTTVRENGASCYVFVIIRQSSN